MSGMFLRGPSEFSTELPLLDSAFVQGLKETCKPRAVCLCGMSQGPQTRDGKGRRNVLEGHEKCSLVGIPALWPVSGPPLPQPRTAGAQQAAARCCCGSKDSH